jgi:hypothetical protein
LRADSQMFTQSSLALAYVDSVAMAVVASLAQGPMMLQHRVVNTLRSLRRNRFSGKRG